MSQENSKITCVQFVKMAGILLITEMVFIYVMVNKILFVPFSHSITGRFYLLSYNVFFVIITKKYIFV